MPQGPRGGPRPMASCSLSVTVEVNAPDGEPSDMLANNLTSRFRRVEQVTITEETETVGGELFHKVIVDIMLSNNEIQLAIIEDIASDIEKALEEERIAVNVETI
jgi:hypothetical protein